MGPNGAGKSTLMRTIAGMQKPISGEVRLDGINIDKIAARDLAKKISVVLTERITIGSLSAYDLVALGRYPHTGWSGKLTSYDHEIIHQTFKIVGATDLTGRMVGELFDGERQKVIVARALAQEPEIILLDEITAFLDLPRRVEIMSMLRDLAHSTKKAILLSTHDLDLALKSADCVWLLSKDGMLQTGAPEDLVLNGGFRSVFDNENLIFDAESGSFEINNQFIDEINLDGSGLDRIWTQRALERNGFKVSRNKLTNLVVKIETDSQSRGWKITERND